MSFALLYALGRLLSPEDTSLSDIAVSPHLTARLVSAPATEDDGQDSSDAKPEGRGGSPLASAPALASLEDEIGSLNSRIRKTRDYCWHLGCILPREPARIARTGARSRTAGGTRAAVSACGARLTRRKPTPGCRPSSATGELEPQPLVPTEKIRRSEAAET